MVVTPLEEVTQSEVLVAAKLIPQFLGTNLLLLINFLNVFLSHQTEKAGIYTLLASRLCPHFSEQNIRGSKSCSYNPLYT